MTLTEKKKRAAIIAVGYYMQTQNTNTNLSNDKWGKMGISRTIHDREILQRKGKTIGIKVF
ncbi:hypothetical protein ACFQZW_11105 [Lutibacter aestuarii]|uniref:Uncharacterized protein n=1 Tax=Lutibacter aestuarii TaxID=861111 RepID=A0ABW2Z9G5_9FLAO|nr:hypothetical protein [uncultured Lutibacter sp.]